MNTIPLYSLVVFPTPGQSDLIKSYKQKLQNLIDCFGSANAAAHITVKNFDDEASLILHHSQIIEFCKTAIPYTIAFNSFDSFGDRTFFIAPDNNSKKYLDKLIFDFNQHLGFKLSKVNAHMSIARGLDEEKMKVACELFKNTTVDFEFVCDAFYLRKFNNQTKQYSDIIEKFIFEGKPQPDLFSL